jgi:hypothetical protein
MTYSVIKKSEIQLDTEEAGDLVAQILQDDFDSISRDIRRLQSETNLQSYEAQDLVFDIQVRDAMKRLLQYYMTKLDYDEFMELQRVYGNVA